MNFISYLSLQTILVAVILGLLDGDFSMTYDMKLRIPELFVKWSASKRSFPILTHYSSISRQRMTETTKHISLHSQFPGRNSKPEPAKGKEVRIPYGAGVAQSV
jgi:hypothetical protein